MIEGHIASCPFCGFSDLELVERQSYYNLPYRWFIKCNECGAQGPVGNTKELALKRWEDRE